MPSKQKNCCFFFSARVFNPTSAAVPPSQFHREQWLEPHHKRLFGSLSCGSSRRRKVHWRRTCIVQGRRAATLVRLLWRWFAANCLGFYVLG
ncbi:hypothetical protein ES319_D05G405900v1 [Gossypium barbadense]|uniref:Uncharacterized protein n=2 Tax=Gossypium TaxID=3633 RepID=A0A5J5RR84_GOSBA|nr:hypothetical protein ES319_D05G405900v1 [Gossypium barbadense]TYG71878.1 hypothetical protein ES288_D05G434500v1 [Gossypium darwinii]